MTNPGSARRGGKIVTFYSYKGGTGRSMALANIAWLLASSGKRVLAIDWDLEAPGLHRYFEPFLPDKTLAQSTGVIDFVRDFATAALAAEPSAGREWYKEYSDLLAHAMPLAWDFGRGALHFVPAGKQDAAYSVRVNSFDWRDFYERLGGGILLERVKQNLRESHDFILIDSRTGVSDTSGICTMQMPDELVVCFTLNRQSIYGASSAARSAYKTRHTASGEPTLKIWPVPTRVEAFEKDRLELASNMARARFSGLVHQLDPEQEDRYWGEIAVGYEPYYAYEEVLAPFRDRPRQTASMLARMETMASYLNGGPLGPTETIDEGRRAQGLGAFTTRSAQDYGEELAWLGEEYERIRKRMGPGDARTELMALLVGRAQALGGQRDTDMMAEKLFSRGTDGARVVGLALARKDPQRQHVELALSGIGDSRSPFEQYHALLLADALIPSLHPTTAAQLQSAIKSQLEKTISRSDPSRWAVAERLIKKLDTMADLDLPQEPKAREFDVAGQTQVMVSITPSSTHVRYDDGDETHGPMVKTRGIHAVRLPRIIRMGRYLVTNSAYLKFIEAGGYENDEFWRSSSARRRFFTSDRESPGPGHWPDSRTVPEGEEEHPVSSISYVEALAFVSWCNAVGVGDSDTVWSLPPEDQWEFVARSEQGFLYPWGDVFDASLCNSAETGIGGTSSVRRFEAGASKGGGCDMAGNVWEFVLADDAKDGSCVLRGGSFSNNRFEVRSYLRLFGVPQGHRPLDFGFRLAQVDAATVCS
jgi:formylglycine-generating enzyme required for sulfatase activity